MKVLSVKVLDWPISLPDCMLKEVKLPPGFTDLSSIMRLPIPTWSINWPKNIYSRTVTLADGTEVSSDRRLHPKIRELLSVDIVMPAPRIKWK